MNLRYNFGKTYSLFFVNFLFEKCVPKVFVESFFKLTDFILQTAIANSFSDPIPTISLSNQFDFKSDKKAIG